MRLNLLSATTRFSASSEVLARISAMSPANVLAHIFIYLENFQFRLGNSCN